MNTALVVLGMHRSGTSALAGALHLLGVPLGGPLVPPAADNERGFWELAEVTEIHEDLLRAFGGSHLHLTPLPEGWLASEAALAVRARLRDVLVRNFEKAPLWAVKDPRLSLLLPLWDGLLEELAVTPKFLVTHRSPWEVARSLAVRNGTPTREALALWERHVSEAERLTRGRDRVFTSFDRLLADPLPELTRLGAALRVSWPVRPESAGAELGAFLSPSNRHWRRPEPPRDADPGVREAADVAYAALERLAAEGEDIAEIARLADACAALRHATAPPPAPRRILFISHDASRTGAPLVLLALVRWLKDNHGIVPRILLRSGGALLPEFRALGDTVIAPQALPDLRFVSGVSLVWVNSATHGSFVSGLPLEGIPVVTHVHELGYVLSFFGRASFPALARRTTRFVACSEAVRENLVAAEGIPSGRISVIHEAVDTRALAARADPSHGPALRRSLGLPDETLLVLGAGTVDWRKGVDLFLQVARTVTAARADVAFVWLGGPSTPVEELRAAHDLRNLGRSGRVFLLGEKADAVPILDAADLFLLTSREDPFPLVMLEAAALGIPTICFDGTGGAPEFCRDAGAVVPYLDVAAMEKVTLELLSEPGQRRTLGEVARRRVRERHDFSAFASRCAAVIEELAVPANVRIGGDPPAVRRGPLPDSGFRLEWLSRDVPERVSSGATISFSVVVRNTGTEVWPDAGAVGGDGRYAVRLGWRIRRGERIVSETGARTDLAWCVAPGESVRLEGRVAAPDEPGRYELQIDLVQELVSWFEEKGAPRLAAPLTVA